MDVNGYRVMTEHPAWLEFDGGHRRLVGAEGGRRWIVRAARGAISVEPLSSTAGEPLRDEFRLPTSPKLGPPALVGQLRGLGVVVRFRNPSVWDALATAIIRQVIRARQATVLYRAFCAVHGQTVEADGRIDALMPSPQIVLDLSDADFAAAGMAFKRHPLRAAAEAYLKHGQHWQQLQPADLVDELIRVPRVGPWTAGAAVADWSNDFSVYPHGDLAVRTWARTAAPGHAWPTTEAAFASAWRQLAGRHLSTLTLLTLAWGKSHGDTS